MKKIIATVLAMVMALALCTTAFAATKTAFGNAGSIPTYDSKYSYELKAAVAAYDKNVGTFQVFKTDADTKAVTNEGMFVKVTKEQAEKILVVGNTITYLAPSTSFGTVYDDKGAAATTVDTLKNCGDVKAEDGVTLYNVGSKLYKAVAVGAAGDKTLLVGDLLVKVSVATEKITDNDQGDFTAKHHSYKADTTTVAGTPTVTKVYCDTCKKSFEFVVGTETDAAAKFGIDGYEEVNAAGYENDAKNIYVKVGSGTPDDGKTNTTTSPKTFDAGIAMYVGMALTSVAGSAVVIGKKKEF